MSLCQGGTETWVVLAVDSESLGWGSTDIACKFSCVYCTPVTPVTAPRRRTTVLIESHKTRHSAID